MQKYAMITIACLLVFASSVSAKWAPGLMDSLVADSGLAQVESADSPASTDVKPATGLADLELELDSEELAKIDWVEEAKKGGSTMIALGVLSVLGLTFFIERLLTLRLRLFAPMRLRNQLASLASEKGQVSTELFQRVADLCRGDNSSLGKAALFVAEHNDQPYEVLSTSVSDIAGRDIRNQIARTSPLAVIAALAPLLGLLGTMIGMIEAFKLVSLYGDDGGASMLADSIAKALITTASGLVLAIPALAAYHFFRHRINNLTNRLEAQLDSLTSLLLRRGSAANEALLHKAVKETEIENTSTPMAEPTGAAVS